MWSTAPVDFQLRQYAFSIPISLIADGITLNPSDSRINALNAKLYELAFQDTPLPAPTSDANQCHDKSTASQISMRSGASSIVATLSAFVASKPPEFVMLLVPVTFAVGP